MGASEKRSRGLDSRTEKQAAERGGSYLPVEESQFFCGHIISLRRVRHCRPSASYFILNNLGFDAVGTYFSNTLFRLSKSIPNRSPRRPSSVIESESTTLRFFCITRVAPSFSASQFQKPRRFIIERRWFCV